MRLFVMHSREGDIRTLVTAPEDAPMAALAEAQPGQMISEVEAPEATVDPTADRGHEDLLRVIRDYRVQATGETALVPRRDRGGAS